MRLVIFFIGVIVSNGAFCQINGQVTSAYPDVFSLYFYNQAQINPGYVPSEGNADFVAGYKARTGAFKKVATYAFTGAAVFRKENATHVARVTVFNEQEGPYISRPAFYANYAYQIPITSKVSIYSGAAFGFSGVYFSAPSATGAGSALLPDGAIGLGIRGENFALGGAAMQILNSEASPINAPIGLNRYYNFTASYKKDISAYWNIHFNGLYRNLPESKDDIFGALSFSYQEIIELGAIAKYQKGLSFFGTVAPLQEKNRFFLSFSYNTPILSDLPNWQNSLELVVGYQVK